MNSEELLVALAIKYDGDWESIMQALQYKKLDDKYEDDEKLFQDKYADLESYLEKAKNADYKYTTILSEDYPSILREQYMPPFVLFYHGDLSLLNKIGNNVGVVGSRECSSYGEDMTRTIVSTVAKRFTIVSGLAIGIDTIAHETALKEGGNTIAVLGGGIDYCYPLRNRKLYEKIKATNLVISEYPGNVLPQPDNFPRRNRIIAMISRGIIVTEAYAHSGTLTTVMFALQCQRLILCVPYPATANSECNRLIAEGAYLIENGNQAIEILERDIHIY